MNLPLLLPPIYDLVTAHLTLEDLPAWTEALPPRTVQETSNKFFLSPRVYRQCFVNSLVRRLRSVSNSTLSVLYLTLFHANASEDAFLFANILYMTTVYTGVLGPLLSRPTLIILFLRIQQITVLPECVRNFNARVPRTSAASLWRALAANRLVAEPRWKADLGTPYVSGTFQFSKHCPLSAEDFAYIVYSVASALPDLASLFPTMLVKTYRICLDVVTQNGANLTFVPEKFKTAEMRAAAARSLLLAQVREFSGPWTNHPFLALPEDLKNFETCCQVLVKYRKTELFAAVPEALLQSVCRQVVKRDCSLLACLPRRARTLDTCILAVRVNKQLLEVVPRELKTAVQRAIVAGDEPAGLITSSGPLKDCRSCKPLSEDEDFLSNYLQYFRRQEQQPRCPGTLLLYLIEQRHGGRNRSAREFDPERDVTTICDLIDRSFYFFKAKF